MIRWTEELEDECKDFIRPRHEPDPDRMHDDPDWNERHPGNPKINFFPKEKEDE